MNKLDMFEASWHNSLIDILPSCDWWFSPRMTDPLVYIMTGAHYNAVTRGGFTSSTTAGFNVIIVSPRVPNEEILNSLRRQIHYNVP